MTEKYIKQLEEFGLSNKEARVYVALLTKGTDTAAGAASKTGLNRSTTYVQIKQLMAHGLVSTYKLDKKTFFIAESPENLEQLLKKRAAVIEAQKQNIGAFLPELLNAYSQHSIRPTIRHFQGKSGLATMRNEVLECTDDKLRVITDYDDISRTFTEAEREEYSNKRKANSIVSCVIYSKKTGKDFEPFDDQSLIRIPKDERPFATDVYIYGNTVSFAAMQQEIVGVTIEQTDIATTMKALFDMYWDTYEIKHPTRRKAATR